MMNFENYERHISFIKYSVLSNDNFLGKGFSFCIIGKVIVDVARNHQVP